MGIFLLNRQNQIQKIFQKLVFAGLIGLLIFTLAGPETLSGSAQSEGEVWGQAFNLSQSGAASQPRIVASPDGRLQAFWWDQFDGLTTSVFDGESWTEPRLASVLSEYLENTPLIVSDPSGYIHAFWIEQVDPQTRQPDDEIHTLMATQMEFGADEWFTPQVIAESAVVFSVSASSDAGVYVAYLRTNHTTESPAGIYVKQNPGNGASWNTSIPAYQSIYYRLLVGEETQIGIQAASETIMLSWYDPRSRQTFLSTSEDEGKSWSDRQVISLGEGSDSRVLFAPLPQDGAVMRLTKTPRDQGCAISQLILPANEQIGLQGNAQTVDAFETSPECPQGDSFWSTSGGLIYIWGAGSEMLFLAAWDPRSQRWSLPIELSVSFIDEQAQQNVDLSDLNPVLQNGRLVVVGTDRSSGEVWVTGTEVSALEITKAGPPVWSKPEVLAQTEEAIQFPILLSGPEDRLHTLWVQQDSSPLSASIYYSGWDGRAWSKPESILPSVQSLSGSPAVVVLAEERLGLAWSAGQPAQINFSWASIEGAKNRMEWSAPIAVSTNSGPTASPALATDDRGRIYLAFAVPFNEQRGIYLTRSDDLGQSWSDAVRIFDGAAAGWERVDQPQLAVGADGWLGVAWSRFSLSSAITAEERDYSYSKDGGQTWSAPEAILQGNIEPNPLLFTTAGTTHTAWLEREPGRLALRHKQETHGSSAWESSTPVTLIMPQPAAAGVAADAGGGLYLLWGEQDSRGRWQLSNQAWNGERWGLQTPLDLEIDQTLSGLVPHISAEGHLNVVYQVWMYDAEQRAAQNLLLFSQRKIDIIPAKSIAPQQPVPTQPANTPQSEQIDPPAPQTVESVDLSQIQASPIPRSSRWQGLVLGAGLALTATALVIGLRFFLTRSGR